MEKEKQEAHEEMENLEEEIDKYYKRMFNERILGYGKGVRSAS